MLICHRFWSLWIRQSWTIPVSTRKYDFCPCRWQLRQTFQNVQLLGNAAKTLFCVSCKRNPVDFCRFHLGRRNLKTLGMVMASSNSIGLYCLWANFKELFVMRKWSVIFNPNWKDAGTWVIFFFLQVIYLEDTLLGTNVSEFSFFLKVSCSTGVSFVLIVFDVLLLFHCAGPCLFNWI